LFNRRPFFIGDSGRYVKDGSGKGYLSLYRSSNLGTWRGLIYRGLRETDEGGLWKHSVSLSLSLSLWELCEGNLEGDS
jgi:hypothetical protein